MSGIADIEDIVAAPQSFRRHDATLHSFSSDVERRGFRAALRQWYVAHKRDLPWRSPGVYSRLRVTCCCDALMPSCVSCGRRGRRYDRVRHVGVRSDAAADACRSRH
jgi:hypothetical protein